MRFVSADLQDVDGDFPVKTFKSQRQAGVGESVALRRRFPVIVILNAQFLKPGFGVLILSVNFTIDFCCR